MKYDFLDNIVIVGFAVVHLIVAVAILAAV